MADATTDAVNAALAANAAGPKVMETDGVRAEQHSLKDQIAAAQHLSQVAAASKPNRGIRVTRIVGPSNV